ncbi:TPA: hypothetical protein N0F65_001386 [Lagenidium giganteum]|uniref:Amino acid transporter n=1 Tax=Lagenidium giganteum TaxID=4803 RepID=A0AAV2YV75_9STRA|nr:TPA: hypothetical protein N0F65_001386 [Lagenidium giganteum]
MHKLSLRTSSELGTPQSRGQSTIHVNMSEPSLQHYEQAGGQSDFTFKTKEEQAEQFCHGLEVKDMFASPYQHAQRVSVVHIIIGAVLGVALGIVLGRYEVSKDVRSWVLLPGDFFIQSLTCLIIPMVFCSVVACIGELLAAGKAAAIGGRTVTYFVMASFTSSAIGTAFGALFVPLFSEQTHIVPSTKVISLHLRCPSGFLLSQQDDGSLSCSEVGSSLSSTVFNMESTSKVFLTNMTNYQVLSITDQVTGILFDVIPDNITKAVAKGSALSVISFAILFGVAVIRAHNKSTVHQEQNHTLLLVTQASVFFRMLINMVVKYIPFAVMSMVAGSVAEYSNSLGLLKSVAFLAVALISALFTLTVGVMGLALFVTTRRNIFTYLRHIVPAQVFIFGCSSSIATLPMTMRCVDSTREVSHKLSRFVLTVGATSNLNGTAVYMPLACIFMAKVGGYSDSLTPVTYVMLALVGALSSFGVAPVPHSGLVMIITVWRTVFGGSVPPVFSLLVGTDWFLNRVRAVVNITNDTIIARIIADQCDETVFSEVDFDFTQDSGVNSPSEFAHLRLRQRKSHNMMTKNALNPLRRASEAESSIVSEMSIPHYEFVALDTFQTKPSQTKQPFADYELPEGVGVKDMLTSSWDSTMHLSVWKVVLAAVVGAGVGVLMAQYNVSADVAKWVTLPGDLFINALKCLIVPMVFCSIVTSIGELISAGKAAAIGGRTVLYFTMASFTSSSIGTIFGATFSFLFKAQTLISSDAIPIQLHLKCPSGNFLSTSSDGALECSLTNGTSIESLINMNDTAKVFSLSKVTFAKLSVSDQVFGILYDLIPGNIFDAFAKGSTLSVISFALLFGIAVVKSADRAANLENYALLLVTHVNIIFRMLINAVIKYIPLAIVSLVAGSMASYGSSTALLESVAFLIVVLGAALLTVVIPVMGSVLFLTTRRNIFSYLRHIVPAQVFIFGCSSSIATLPMTMRCVDSTREVSHALSRFVLSVGATSNLNGTAVYMPLACIFMAKVGGYEERLTPVTYVMLAFVGAIASYGVAPVPHSGLVMVITVWRTVFGIDVPPVFSLLVGADWILNRMRAIVNITNDTIIARIIADQCDETTMQEFNEYDDELCTPPSNSPM